MSKAQRSVLAVDFGGTQIRAARVERDGSILDENYGLTGDGEPGVVVDRIISVVARSWDAAARASDEPAAISIAAPGPIDFARGVILKAPNIAGFANVPICDAVADRFGVPVFLQNDANAAALAEHEFGAGRGFDHMVYLTISSGIGAGIIAHGRLLRGATGNAGEVGQMTVDLNDRVYLSGCLGTMEGQASGDHLANYAASRLAAGQRSSLAKVLAGGGELDGAAVVEAAREGDPLALATWQRALAGLGAGTVSFVHVLNPEIIVVGGGVANAGEMLFGPLRDYVKRWALPGFSEHLQIVPAALGNRVGLLGAAVWGWRNQAGQA